MIEQRVKIISEALARTFDRRTFLRRTGTTIASGVATLALGSVLTKSTANAETKQLPSVPLISCSPPGPYCNTGGGNLSGCRGGECFQHNPGSGVVACRVYYQYYAVGCWTTAVTGGYWTCCDCQCTNGSTCGCAQFHPTNAPIPE